MSANKTIEAIDEAVAALRAGTPKGSPSSIQLAAAIRLADVVDDVEWTEKGLAEWRATALAAQQHARKAQAVALIAIDHLQAVLNTARSHHEQQAADTSARSWLTSIGSEPS